MEGEKGSHTADDGRCKFCKHQPAIGNSIIKICTLKYVRRRYPHILHYKYSFVYKLLFQSWTIAIFTASSNSRSTENDEALNYDYTIAARPWIERVCSARNSHYTDFFWQENAEMNALLSRSSFQVIAEREKE